MLQENREDNMSKKIEKLKNCTGCHACYSACPVKCIDMNKNKYGFLLPQINKDKCINCNKCEKSCPIINPNNNIEEEKFIKEHSYVAFNKNDDIRKVSSSGGIFYLIAKAIIDDGGVVFGAAFDESFKVKHMEICEVKEIYKLQGSKYVQSEIGEIYLDVKKRLEDNIPVLFTGTPCQIEGLKSFLYKEYDNLYTQDIICHGVPSPLVWEKYLHEFDGSINNISFRDKTFGWNNFSMRIDYNDSKYIKTLKEDSYMKSFLLNLSLRDSCYNCDFKKNIRCSDITLADYWGIENVHKDMFDDKGASLIIIQSNKGLGLFNKIKENLYYKSTNLDVAIKYNTAINKSVDLPNKRTFFLENIKNYSLDNLLEACLKESKKDMLKRQIVRILRRIKRMVKF